MVRPSPSSGSGLRSPIERDRLVASAPRLGEVGVVVAPAGSGKSVLLAQWGARGNATALLPLTAAHDDAVVLAGDLAAALDGAVGTTWQPPPSASPVDGSRLGPGFVEWLREVLESPLGPDLLVLDDLHVLTNSGVLEDLAQVVLEPPEGCAVAVGSRWDPPFALSRLRLSGRLVELRAAELAFDETEAHRMVERVSGRALGSELVASLVGLTEGWAAGLYLAALSMQRRDPEPFVEGYAGDDRLVVEYLTTEVLDAQPETLRRFLLLTSVLEWMTPELCDAVTGNDDGRELLGSLVDRNLFVSSVEPRTGRVRYHHLFADLLRYQLAAERPGVAERSRRRAAEWLLANGDVRAAIEQVLAAGEYAHAFEAAVQHALVFFERGETASLVHWLEQVQRSGAAEEPIVTINLLAAQTASEEFVASGETCRRLANSVELTTGEQVAVDALCSLGGLGDLPTSEMRRCSTKALDELARIERSSVPGFFGLDGADTCEIIASFTGGLADFYDDDLEGAAARLQRTTGLAGARYPIWFINCSGALGLVNAFAGRPEAAHRVATMSLDAATDTGAEHHMAASLAHLAMAAVRLDELDPDTAGPHLDAAAAIVRGCRRPTYHQLLELLEVRRRVLTDGPRAGLEFLRSHRPGGTQRTSLERMRQTLEIELLLAVDATSAAASLLEQPGAVSPTSRIDVLLATEDVRGARRLLTDWRPVEPTPRAAMERELRMAALHRLEGNVGAAMEWLAPAMRRAESHGLLVPFLSVPLAVDVLRSSPHSPRVESVLRYSSQRRNRAQANSSLAEPLTARELAVLDLMSSRLNNADLAAALFVSVNTLKTHSRNIYRKLAVSDREEAVRAASRAGLLSGEMHR